MSADMVLFFCGREEFQNYCLAARLTTTALDMPCKVALVFVLVASCCVAMARGWHNPTPSGSPGQGRVGISRRYKACEAARQSSTVLFAKKKTKKKSTAMKKKGFVKPGEGSNSYNKPGKCVDSASGGAAEMFPPLSEEMQSTLIECREDEPPPTIEQIENRIAAVYGFAPSLGRHESR